MIGFISLSKGSWLRRPAPSSQSSMFFGNSTSLLSNNYELYLLPTRKSDNTISESNMLQISFRGGTRFRFARWELPGERIERKVRYSSQWRRSVSFKWALWVSSAVLANKLRLFPSIYLKYSFIISGKGFSLTLL